MDAHVKEGQLYVQHQKFGKKWKKNWFVLYPASLNGIARLEFFDSHSGGGGSGGGSTGSNEKTRKLDKKIIRLSECISILPALTESCPKDNMSAFCVETNDKNHVFAAEKHAAKEWMDIMCDIAFQGGSGSTVPDCNGGAQDLQMSENLIYFSREEVNEFWVGIQRTEASERCGLAGNYWLKAEKDALILMEPKTKRNIQVWPYKLLRRYGRDRVMFSFEAGRRCDSGPGSFTFETKQGNEIFTLVDRAIQSQKALAEESQQSCLINNESECPQSLQFLRNALPGVLPSTTSGDSSSCSSREADGDSGGSKPGSADGVLGKREGGDGGGGKGQASSVLKGRCLPEPPSMLGVLGSGGTPPRSPRGQAAGKSPPSVADEQVGLYSEPADSVRLPIQITDSLYSDPVDSIMAQSKTCTNQANPPVPTLRLRPVGDEDRKLPDLYSHVYDHISLEVNQKTSALSLNGARTSGGERGGAARGVATNRRPPGGQAEGASSPPGRSQDHIYDEPEGCAKGCNLGKTIYDEATGPLGPEGNHSTPSYGKSSDLHKHSSLQHGPSRAMPPAPRWPKPLTAPKPGRAVTRKEPVALPSGKHSGTGTNANKNNNNNSSSSEEKELYSKVSKPKPVSSWHNHQYQAPLRSPDIITDNMGKI